MNKIKNISIFFRFLFQILFISLPILLIIGWANAPDSIVLMGGAINMSFIPKSYSAGAQGAILHPLSFSEKMLGLGVSAIPLLLQLYIFYSLIKLFKLYEKGEIFSINNVNHIRKIGFALLLTQLIEPLYQALMGIVLTWHNPPGHRFVGITLDQTNIGIILIALIVILISWIMAEGCKLNEEQQLTV